MAVTYPWKWVRGLNYTVTMNMGAGAMPDTYTPVTLAANVLNEAGAAEPIWGVVPTKAAANETRVAVIVSPDIFQVQAFGNLGLGDLVQMRADGSVAALTSGVCCGEIVDYDPANNGQAHIRAAFYHGIEVSVIPELVVLTDFVRGDIVAAPSDRLVGVASSDGTIALAGFSLGNTGADGTDDLSFELDVLINGVSIFTTPPALTKAAADGADTFTAGAGVTVGVIDAAANIVAAGDLITVAYTLDRTTPEDEIADLDTVINVAYA